MINLKKETPKSVVVKGRSAYYVAMELLAMGINFEMNDGLCIFDYGTITEAKLISDSRGRVLNEDFFFSPDKRK